MEVCSAGRWLSLCASEFTDYDAGQICSNLGHSRTGNNDVIQVRPNDCLFSCLAHAGSLSTRSLFPSNSPTQSLVYDKLVCLTGNISSCLRDTTEVTLQCPSRDLAEVVCGGKLIDLVHCMSYCFTDVGAGQCNNGHVRLVGIGSTSTQGRVEVCLGGEWGTVCDDSWDNNAATVACNQLGLPTDGENIIASTDSLSIIFNISAAISTSGSQFGQGAGKIFLSNVKCHGNESRLVGCSSRGYLAKDCQHSEDAGVICRGMYFDNELDLITSSLTYLFSHPLFSN